MEKRSNYDWRSELVELPEEEVSETVKVMLMHDVILNYTGVFTGKLYVFNRGGSTQDVDTKDAEIMLKRKEQRSCCGSISSPYFELVR
jgi:hypothetical protein